MFKTDISYRVRSGRLSAYDVQGRKWFLALGDEVEFISETKLIHPECISDIKHYNCLLFDVDGSTIFVYLPKMKVYPVPDKNPDKWYDNSLDLMFEEVK